MLLVLVFALGVRLISAPEIDTGDDGILKWYNGKILLSVTPGQWNWSHHTARFGMVLPMLLVQSLVAWSRPRRSPTRTAAASP